MKFFLNQEQLMNVLHGLVRCKNIVEELDEEIEADPLLKDYSTRLLALLAEGIGYATPEKPAAAQDKELPLEGEEGEALKWLFSRVRAVDGARLEGNTLRYSNAATAALHGAILEGAERLSGRPEKAALLRNLATRVQPPAPPAPKPVVNKGLASVVADLFAQEEVSTDTSIFAGFNFYKGEDLNGDPNDIFKWLLNVDPLTCTPTEFVRGLLMTRVVSDAGKVVALKQADIVELCLRRNFAGWGHNTKTVKVEVTKLCADLKSSTTFTAADLKKQSLNYPTLASYSEQHFDNIRAASTPELPADDLEGVFRAEAGLPPLVIPHSPAPSKPANPSETLNKVDRARKMLGLL